MDLKKLGSFKISDSINTQWKVNLAVDRIRVANGQKSRGYASVLNFLDRMGAIFSIVFGLIIIIGVVIYKIFSFLYSLTLKPAADSVESMRAKDSAITYKATTEVDEEEICISMDADTRILNYDERMQLSSLISENGFNHQFFDGLFFLLDHDYIYSVDREELITSDWSYSDEHIAHKKVCADSFFQVYHIPVSNIELIFNWLIENGQVQAISDSVDFENAIHKKLFALYEAGVNIEEGRTATHVFQYDGFCDYLERD